MSTTLLNYLDSVSLMPPLSEAETQYLTVELARLSDLQVYPRSITAIQHSLLFLGRQSGEKFLAVLSTHASPIDGLTGHTNSIIVDGTNLILTIAPTSASNAATLRRILPFLTPKPLGLRKSAGCGDRLGLATPGHIRAIRNSGMAPILAQQSMRENARTGRTPQRYGEMSRAKKRTRTKI